MVRVTVDGTPMFFRADARWLTDVPATTRSNSS